MGASKVRGRPKITLSAEQIEQVKTMAGLGLNLNTIAQILGLSPRTLDNRIAEDRKKFEAGKSGGTNLFCAIEKGRATGDAKLSEAAFKMALSGKHPAMTIFLCKVRLGMRENSPSDNDNKEFKLAYTVGGK